MVNTDKVLTQNGADFTFVCGKVPFAISCSTDLTHRNFNMIDLELINKMKIPLKNIRVTRMSMQGHDLRCVGVVSQTIQCVVNGKISGTIHLYAKVVRDLYNSISVDCLASRRTYLRLMGCDPEEEPPDDPSVEVLGGEEDESTAEDDDVRESNAKGNDVRESNAKGDDVRESNAKRDDVRESNAKRDDVGESIDEGENVTSPNNDEDLSIIKGIPSYCYSTTPFDEKSLYPDEWQDCYDSDGNYDTVLTDFVNNDHGPEVYYQRGQLHRMTKRRSNSKSSGRTRTSAKTSPADKHCQYCFVSGEPIKVTQSHNVLDIDCPSMTDDDRRRIHGDQETDRWLARLYGYHD